MNYPYTFVINGYNHDTKSYYEQCGIGICTSFSDASHQLEVRYGDELVSIKHLSLYDSDNVINVSKNTLKEIIGLLERIDVSSKQLSEKEVNKI